MALRKALGNDPFLERFGVRRARNGIGGRDVVYLMFPGSATPGEPFDTASIEQKARRHFHSFGGAERLKACAAAINRK